ncbi:hypothetical protein F441_06869 [Phytophthora nicotianae CJ01A1]|nr:hypothetical protein L917_06549 [Phytophthora nicotianae]ETP18981.1 hypothetical protein F441_06869 [Phytophthora nicotianae CJ01A1]
MRVVFTLAWFVVAVLVSAVSFSSAEGVTIDNARDTANIIQRLRGSQKLQNEERVIESQHRNLINSAAPNSKEDRNEIKPATVPYYEKVEFRSK